MSEGCGREKDVLRATRSSQWAPELRDHAAECTDCQDVGLVARLLLREADRAEEEARDGARLLEPDLAWLRYQKSRSSHARTKGFGWGVLYAARHASPANRHRRRDRPAAMGR